MELTPKLLTEDVDFRVAYRGYDRDEVDDFLERVAVAVGQLQQQLAEAVSRARSAESRLSKAPAEAPAAAAAPSAETEDLNEELRRTLVLAQRTADSAIREAREEAAQLQADAEERAQRAIADAEAAARRKGDEARAKLLAEIAELEGIRESMRGDVTVLERHLEEQRLQLRSSFQELQRLLDDPGSFRIAPAPPLSGVAAPAASSESAGDPRRPVQGADGDEVPREAAAAPRRSQEPTPPPAAGPEPAASRRPAEPEPPAGDASPPSPSGSVSFREGASRAAGEQLSASSEASSAADPGPRTQPVAAARFEEDDSNDAFLAELRKAMADEADAAASDSDAKLFDQDERDRGRPRFGRRH